MTGMTDKEYEARVARLKREQLLADEEKLTAEKRALANQARQVNARAALGDVAASGYASGTVTTGEKAGSAETQLLAAKALAQAAEAVVERLRAETDGRQIVLIGGMSAPRCAVCARFQAQVDILKKGAAAAAGIEAALKDQFFTKGKSSPATEAQVEAAKLQVVAPGPGMGMVAQAVSLPALSAAGAIASTLANLGSFFRSDYTVSGTEATTGNEALLSAIAGAFVADAAGRRINPPRRVVIPSRLPRTCVDPQLRALLDPVNAIAEISAQRAAIALSEKSFAQAEADAAGVRASAAQTAAATERNKQYAAEIVEIELNTTEEKAKARQKADIARRRAEQEEARFQQEARNQRSCATVAAIHGQIAASWQDVAKGADALRAALLTPSDGKTLLDALIDDMIVCKAVDEADLLLLVDVVSSGGSAYTAKNLWSFLGGMPFHVATGVVVNYCLIGKDGGVRLSGVEPAHGGFFRIGAVAGAVNRYP